MRIGTPVQIVKSYFVRITVHIHHDLLQKVCVIIFGIDIQRFAKYRYVGGYTGTIVPCFFHVQSFRYFDLSAAGKQVVVFCQYMIRTVTFSGREAEVYVLIRIVFKMCTGSHKETVLIAIVTTQTCHQHPLIIQIQRVLRIGSGNRFFGKSLDERQFRLILQPIMLVISVIVETQPRRETVLLIKLCFKHQRGIHICLVYIV